ncbi:MAG: bioC [Rickettsiales bacterium]|jgi:malonyl-CoA O-methyltransferase|nr:bioC [Rickettsiales bacterium]
MNKQRIRDDFSRASTSYDAHAALQKNVAELLYHEALNHFPETGIILDAGCGTGSLARENANRKPWHIIQCDSAFGMCNIASSLASTVSGDIETLPFADQSFDGIYSSLALQWVNAHHAAQEYFRSLKPSNHLILTTFGAGTLHELHHAIHESCTAFSPHTFITENQLRDACAQAGFEHISLTTIPFYTYHSTVTDLLKSMKTIGAGAKSSPIFTARSAFARLEAQYRLHHATPEGLKATWNILVLIARRPE